MSALDTGTRGFLHRSPGPAASGVLKLLARATFRTWRWGVTRWRPLLGARWPRTGARRGSGARCQAWHASDWPLHSATLSWRCRPDPGPTSFRVGLLRDPPGASDERPLPCPVTDPNSPSRLMTNSPPLESILFSSGSPRRSRLLTAVSVALLSIPRVNTRIARVSVCTCERVSRRTSHARGSTASGWRCPAPWSLYAARDASLVGLCHDPPLHSAAKHRAHRRPWQRLASWPPQRSARADAGSGLVSVQRPPVCPVHQVRAWWW